MNNDRLVRITDCITCPWFGEIAEMCYAQPKSKATSPGRIPDWCPLPKADQETASKDISDEDSTWVDPPLIV